MCKFWLLGLGILLDLLNWILIFLRTFWFLASKGAKASAFFILHSWKQKYLSFVFLFYAIWISVLSSSYSTLQSSLVLSYGKSLLLALRILILQQPIKWYSVYCIFILRLLNFYLKLQMQSALIRSENLEAIFYFYASLWFVHVEVHVGSV